MTSRTNQAYGGRATDHPNRLSSRLFEIAESKKTNITLSADVTTTEELLDIADSMMASSLAQDSLAGAMLTERVQRWDHTSQCSRHISISSRTSARLQLTVSP